MSLPLGLLFLLESAPSGRGDRAGWEEVGGSGRVDCGWDLVEDDLVWIVRGRGGGGGALGCGASWVSFPG